MWLSTFPGQRRLRRSFHRLCHYLALERLRDYSSISSATTTKRRMYTAADIYNILLAFSTFRRNTQHRSRRHGPARSLAPRANLLVHITRTTFSPGNFFFFNGALGSFALTHRVAFSRRSTIQFEGGGIGV